MGAAKQKLVVVCGPTACGKSDLALYLAGRFGGEVIAADSMQVYRGLVIGTAATTPQAAGKIPLHLTGFLPPEQSFSVADWVAGAKLAIADIGGRGRLPVVCGGTGLYIQSLVKGISFTETLRDDGLREQLEHQWQALGPEAMQKCLAARDPERAEKLHLKDKKRILWALEQALLTGLTAAEREAASLPGEFPFDTLLLGLRFRDRQVLYNCINRRVDAMMQAGLLAEAHTVWENRERFHTAAQAIGYKEFFPYFAQTAALDACVDKLRQATRNYAKRQLTWFGRMEGIHWLEAGSPETKATAESLTALFLQNQADEQREVEGRRTNGTE